jgi:hypothetical protein
VSEQHTVPSEPEPAEGTIGPADPENVEQTEENEKEDETEGEDEDDAKEDQIDHSLDDVANEVIRGEWGEGQEQRQRLAEAGYDHNKVREAVTRIRNNL